MDKCKYCDTPYGGDLDENGELFCDCIESRYEKLQEALIEIRAEARSWLKPDLYPDENFWLKAKLNRIAAMASRVLPEVR